MGTRSRCAFAFAVLFFASTVHAVTTHWEAHGHLTELAGPDVPADFTVGTPFRIVAQFKTDATLDVTSAGTASGFRHNYTSPVRFLIYIGTTCNPCSIDDQTGFVFVRDNYADFAGDPPVAPPAVDGYSVGGGEYDDEPKDWIELGLIVRGTNLDVVNGPALPVEPDPRLAGQEVSVVQVCAPSELPFNDPKRCSRISIIGHVDSLVRSTYGTGYLFTARDCRIPENPNGSEPNDCFNGGRVVNGQFVNGSRLQRWSVPALAAIGGGVGAGPLEQSHAPMSGDIDASANDGRNVATALAAQLGLQSTSLGSLFGSISFGGPAALPVIKGNAFPSDISRNNANLFAYQKYNYSGGVTQLPLVLDLTYTIDDNSNDPTANRFVGNRPGGAEMSAVLTIIDGNVPIETIKVAGDSGFGLSCGDEAQGNLPPNSILGSAWHLSAPGESGPQAVVMQISSCANPGQPIVLAAGQDFYVATSMQTPARGKAPQPGTSSSVTENGFVDSAHTLRVAIDPTASPAVVAALVENLEPACGATCEQAFEPDPVTVQIDIKPGSTDDCVNVGSKGVIPVALLGSASFGVQQVVLDDSLRLGALTVRSAGGGKRMCSIGEVNGDSHADLVCHFNNARSNWHSGQAMVTLTGTLVSGGAFEAHSGVCLKP